MTFDPTGLTPTRVGQYYDVFDHSADAEAWLVRDSSESDLMDNEAQALEQFEALPEKDRPFFPSILERFDHDGRVGIITPKMPGWHTLAEVQQAYPQGLDGRDVVWMWRKLLAAMGIAHRLGTVHTAILPQHVLVHGTEHGLMITDWAYSVDAGNKGRAIVADQRWMYAPEVLDGRELSASADIYMSAKTMELMFGKAATPLRAFVQGNTLPDPSRRPDDAWVVLSQLTTLMERLYGPRKYRVLEMPPV